MGGANALALEIADAIGALPVITTATDLNGAFPADVFAKENGLAIANREGIAKVSSSALEGRPVTVCIKDYPPAEHVDVLIADREDAAAMKDAASMILCPKRYAVGMGCRRGKSFEELRDFAERVLSENGIDLKYAGCIATIDIKKDEEGLRSLSRAWRMPLITFGAELLRKAEGDFRHSELVLQKTGTDNVCERAAVLAAGRGSHLVIRKTAENGMTIAVAKRI
jgi:cobalt-precorrin 5A hydrolase